MTDISDIGSSGPPDAPTGDAIETKPKRVGATKSNGAETSSASASTRDRIKDEALSLKGQATDKALSFANQGKERATGALNEASRFLEDTARTVDEKLGAQYGGYARTAAQSVAGFASTLESKNVDELVDDARELIRKSPALAIGAAATIGFLLARLVKSGAAYEEEADAKPSRPTGSSPRHDA